MAYINGQEILFSPRISITGNGSGIDAILPVESLPTENISTKHFYRTSDGVYWYDGENWHELGECGIGDIVVPAQGSRGNSNFVESIPGLVKLYNESAGLSLDEYGQLGIVAATTTDIDKEESLRKPIVPKTMRHAMRRYSYKASALEGLYPGDEDEYLPIAAITAKNFVLKNALNFKLYKIPRGEMFEVKPGMMALVLPYGDYTLSLHESETSSAKVSKMGATVVMATDWGADAEDGNCFWVACMSAKTYNVLGVEIPTMGSNHTKYTQNCYIKNNDTGTSGTGYAYVYYISRGED